MTEATHPFPPMKIAQEPIREKLSNIQRDAVGNHEEESVYQQWDTHGEAHVCQAPLNRWMRCKKANPVSFDVTLVCRKFHEDFIECWYSFKSNTRDDKAKKLWRDYEINKTKGNLQNTIKPTKFRPLYSE